MIILDNYNRINTYIVIEGSKYKIVRQNELEVIEDGVGGFSEDEELLGVYVNQDKLYFVYENDKYETNADELICVRDRLKNGMCNFKVSIKDRLVCDITYKPYISPFVLTFGDDEDEFDFLLYLSNLLKSKDSILNFIKGMNNLKNS